MELERPTIVCWSKIHQKDAHHGLMDLACSNFLSKYYNINLQMIRDEAVRSKRSSPCDIKAYFSTIVGLGAEITNRDTFRIKSEHVRE